MKISILILCLIFLTVPLVAQSYDINIKVSPKNMVYNYIYPANFNPEDPMAQPLIIQASIKNNTSTALDYELSMRMSWSGDVLIPNVIIEPDLPLNPNQTVIITNQDMINSDGSSGFSTHGYNFDNFFDSNHDFEDFILDQGYLPDGTYNFEFKAFEKGSNNTVDDNQNALSDKGKFSFKIITPAPISLITPGSPINMGAGFIPDGYPQFVWFSNFQNYILRLYEIDDINMDEEEIEQLDPFLEETISNYITNYSYKTSDPVLEENQLYAWNISSKLNNPFGNQNPEISSIFYVFKLNPDVQQQIDDQTLVNFVNQLNADGTEDIINLIQNGFSLENINMEGQEMSAQELYELLMKIASGEIEVESITVE